MRHRCGSFANDPYEEEESEREKTMDAIDAIMNRKVQRAFATSPSRLTSSPRSSRLDAMP